MKHKYKIRVDEPVPSDEQISRHKSFDGLLADYHNLTQPVYRKPLYKNPKAFAGLIFILMLGWLVFEAVDEEDKRIAAENLPAEIRDAAAHAFLHPAIDQLAVAYTPHEIPAHAAQEISLPSGTKVSIPADAFVDQDGQAVRTETVTLRIREFNDPFQLLAAGIPMHTDRDDKPLQLESTAMIEIIAEANGAPLSLRKEGQPLSIAFPGVGQEPSGAIRLFHLDTAARHWKSLPPAFSTQKRATPDKNMVGHLPNSGFNVVEFDDAGNPIVEESTADTATTTYAYHQTVLMEELGLISLDYPLENQRYENAQVRFTDASGKALKLYALYQLIDGVNTVGYFWPRDKDFTFDLRYLPGIPQQIFALTETGHLARLEADRLAALTPGDEVQTLPLQVSDRPVENISQLKQLLYPDPGQ